MSQEVQVGEKAGQGVPVPRTSPEPAPIRRLAQASLALAVVYTLFMLAGAVLSWRGEPQIETGSSGLRFMGMAGPLAVVVAIASVALWIVTCVWLSRARTNSERLSAVAHTRGPVWVWLGWIVPIVSFWFPFQVVRDILRGSPRGTAPPGLHLGAWWTCWVIPQLLQPAAGTTSTKVSHSDPQVFTTTVTANPWVTSGQALLTIVALVLWWRIVRSIVDAQRSTAA